MFTNYKYNWGLSLGILQVALHSSSTISLYEYVAATATRANRDGPIEKLEGL
jgi:hypothetical protein